MGLNKPKLTQKTLNISKIILYELKIGLNELKWALTLIWVGGKFTPMLVFP